jgi:hypothetical protein
MGLIMYFMRAVLRIIVLTWVSNVCLCVTSGEPVVSEALGGPQEELVSELRARIRDLEQRQEWLLREGETLQVRHRRASG